MSADENTIQSPIEKRAELKNMMLKKMRPYPLKHEWAFWHERNDPNATDYASRLSLLSPVNTVQTFWQVFNNTPFSTLAIRDSLHMFKKGVKPLWEDPRNARGGCWTFRVPKNSGFELWKEVLLAAIGEGLAEGIARGDDICGVSISVRFNSHLIMVWNRAGDNEQSINNIRDRVLENFPEELRPVPENYYYKKHEQHAGFGEVKNDGQTSAEKKEGETQAAV